MSADRSASCHGARPIGLAGRIDSSQAGCLGGEGTLGGAVFWQVPKYLKTAQHPEK